MTRERMAIKELAIAAHAGDAERFVAALEEIDGLGRWRPAMRAIARKPCPEEFRRRFLNVYLSQGDHIRSEVDDDLVFIDALKSLLPHYTGKDQTLYRGDSAFNRKRRAYGLAWTASCDVARHYATGLWHTFEGGSVLLQAFVPKEAIICAPALIDDRYADQEYLVDRRQLRCVRVIERFTQAEHQRPAPP
jgi:hypothetical protein